MKKYLENWEILFKHPRFYLPKALVLALLFAGFVVGNHYQLACLVVAGLISGIFNGFYDDAQWRAESEKSNVVTPEDRLHKKPGDALYRTHKMFLHIICGLVAGICLFILLSHVNLNAPLRTALHLSFADLFLFVFALTGFAGIVPRAIWYWSYSGRLPE